MFISKLNLEQQSVLLALAERIAAVDGVSHEKEALLMAVLKAQSQDGVAPATVELSELAGVFDSQSAKSALMLELLGIAFADSDYQKSEKALVNEVANALSIDSGLLSDMESWVSRQLLLTQEANRFMEEA